MAQHRRILVLGGTGHVGSAVVEAMAPTDASFDQLWLTYHENEARARALTSLSPGVEAIAVDLADPDAVVALVSSWPDDTVPDTVIHCATQAKWVEIEAISLALWQEAFDVNVRSAFLLMQALWPRWQALDMQVDVVLAAAINGNMSVPSPVAFGSTQGAIAGLVRSLSKAMGPRVKINAAMFGPLDGGISDRLDPALIKDYEHFSSLGRVGTAQEAAKLIRWLALENDCVTGRVINANGGL